MADMTKRSSSSLISTICVFLLAILLIITLTNRWNINMSTFSGSLLEKNSHLQETINCSLTCSETSPLVTKRIADTHDPEECPEYFKWIHEDLKPWRVTGITREMVEKAKNVAHIRIVIVNGRVYVKKYKRVFQTRDVVTVWGMLQLLRMYPGRLPDLDLMFECDDRPVIKKREYSESNASTTPPPLFHYCGDELSYDIVFPDWSFWGWPELNIEPWEMLKEKLAEGNRKIEWKNREPYAYWKGNTLLGAARRDLVKCNATKKKDTKARIFHMDWNKDIKQGFVGSDLTNQCTYRYKIYAEGRSWSVSEKYILACDSMSLIITPHYYDFFSRSLLPGIHYWPISEADKCKSIDSAVEMGNNYTEKAQNIGKAGSKFIQESLAMKYVYDYMFHLLSEYGKLMKYKPTVPRGAVEMCSEALFCSVTGKERRYRENSLAKSPSDSNPCTFPR